MNRTLRRCLLVVFCATCSGAGLAQTALKSPSSDALQARFERMPERELKTMFLHCSRESSRRVFHLAEAANCSASYEVLKRRSFSGDFDALLAWWRAHRDDPLEAMNHTGELADAYPN